MELITKENCREIVQGAMHRHTGEHIGDIDMKAESWKVVYDLCKQLGMNNKDESLSGIERVVGFIMDMYKEK